MKSNEHFSMVSRFRWWHSAKALPKDRRTQGHEGQNVFQQRIFSFVLCIQLIDILRIIDYLVVNAAQQSTSPRAPPFNHSLDAHLHSFVRLTWHRICIKLLTYCSLFLLRPLFCCQLAPTFSHRTIQNLLLFSCHDIEIKQRYLKPDLTAKGIPQIRPSLFTFVHHFSSLS